MIKLSVNVNKVATLRNSRGGTRAVRARGGRRVPATPARPGSPSIRAPTRGTSRRATCARSRRCSRPRRDASSSTSKATRGPTCSALVHAVAADQCTLVPVRPGEITSQAGWSADAPRRALPASIATCGRRRPGEPVRRPGRGADPLGGGRRAPTASSCTPSRSPAPSSGGPRGRGARFDSYAAAAELAHALGLGVNAGHDLDLDNLVLFRRLPHLAEVSIGHALISHALFVGGRRIRSVARAYLRRASPGVGLERRLRSERTPGRPLNSEDRSGSMKPNPSSSPWPGCASASFSAG